jgi:aminopeptidase N
MTELIQDIKAKKPLSLNLKYVEAFGKILKDPSIDSAFRSLSMSIPAEGIMHQDQSEIMYRETKEARDFVKKTLAEAHHETLFNLYQSVNIKSEYKLDPKSMGDRDLKANCLSYLSLVSESKYSDLAFNQFNLATNMTDEIGALGTLINSNSNHKETAIKSFYSKWKHETLVMQKWLTVQGADSSDSTYDNILTLENDPIYDRTIPNLVRSLLGQFAMNKTQFNHPSGRGYKLIADRMIEIDKLNPQVASRLASAYKDFKRIPASLQILMKPELERVLAAPGLSKNVFEIVSKILV